MTNLPKVILTMPDGQTLNTVLWGDGEPVDPMTLNSVESVRLLDKGFTIEVLIEFPDPVVRILWEKENGLWRVVAEGLVIKGRTGHKDLDEAVVAGNRTAAQLCRNLYIEKTLVRSHSANREWYATEKAP